MIPLESPVPEIGTLGSVSGERKRCAKLTGERVGSESLPMRRSSKSLISRAVHRVP